MPRFHIGNPNHRPTMATIYRKSAKGAEEIATRKYRLLPKYRSALITVDGHKTDQELAATWQLLGNGAEILAHLVNEGFIEPESGTSAGAAAPAAPPAMSNSQAMAHVGAQTGAFMATLRSALGGGAAASAHAAPAPPTEPVTEPATAPPAGAPLSASLVPSSPQRMAECKRAAVRFLNDTLGPDAESLCIRIEQAGTPAQLVAQLTRAREVLSDFHSKSKSAQFWALVSPFLSV
jgi:hypothetical protein